MESSALRLLDRRFVSSIADRVRMSYDTAYLARRRIWGEWCAENSRILIYPREQSSEDHIIIHEWLHVLEDVRLKVEKGFRETQIDWWAHYHLRTNPGLVKYIRGIYRAAGF